MCNGSGGEVGRCKGGRLEVRTDEVEFGVELNSGESSSCKCKYSTYITCRVQADSGLECRGYSHWIRENPMCVLNYLLHTICPWGI